MTDTLVVEIPYWAIYWVALQPVFFGGIAFVDEVCGETVPLFLSLPLVLLALPTVLLVGMLEFSGRAAKGLARASGISY